MKSLIYDMYVRFFSEQEKIYMLNCAKFLVGCKGDGYCGFVLSEYEAQLYFSEFESCSNEGLRSFILPIPVCYRDSKLIEKDAATQYAKSYIVASQEKYKVDEIKISGESPVCWEFRVPFVDADNNPDLVGQPTFLRVYVDKVDGHIWGDKEMDFFMKRWSKDGQFELAVSGLYDGSVAERGQALNYLASCGHKGVFFALKRFLAREANPELLSQAKKILGGADSDKGV